jgi:hypothetical protein
MVHELDDINAAEQEGRRVGLDCYMSLDVDEEGIPRWTVAGSPW